MLFNSALYGVFLLGTYVVFWLSAARPRLRTLFLVAASYAFYFYGTYDAARDEEVPFGPVLWSVLCLAIIFLGSTLDYGIGRGLEKTDDPRKRKALLIVSLLYYGGVLSLFKYFNFAADSISAALHAAGVNVNPIHLRLVLPFGISFFTFETMSYTIDVYRRTIPAARRYGDYLLFVCFFPHLVAGPIVRPHQMLPQLARAPVADFDSQARGLFRIAKGLAKKIVIGDVLAVGIVGRVFDNPERYSSLEVVVAVYAYAIQIYMDFSGYSDVALGSAQLFGYELPENFRSPYLARNLQDFWRRWHITLSTWLRDYLYVPLGGSRGSQLFTYRNLMITMLLGGLWHGASWNFVIWGGLHGLALAVTRIWQRALPPSQKAGPTVGSVVAVVLTFHYVCFAWIFFRAPTFEHASLMIGRIAHLSFSIDNVSGKVALALAVGVFVHVFPRRLKDLLRDSFVQTPSWVQGVVLAFVAYGIHLAAGAKAEPFVYGQF
jgi:alginate O-acetyltransferase complex protein AlgI